MASNFTSFLIRQLIPELAETYGSATKALESLKGSPLAMRKQDFLNIWRETLDFTKKADTWKYAAKDKIISAASMTQTEKAITTLYQHIGNISFTDTFGNAVERQISFGTNDLMTPDEIEEELQNVIDESSGTSTAGIPSDYTLTHIGSLAVM